jgi:hypothetical protein
LTGVVNDRPKSDNLMKIVKKYIIVIAIALPVLILITVKTFNATGFKYDAKRWSGPSFNGSNLVSISGLSTIQGNKLIVILDNGGGKEFDKSIVTVSIPPDDILERKNLKLIREHKGPVLLYSADPSLSSRIWMIISQTGVKDIYILTDSKDNEILKYKFRPDTIARPEFTN